jgi:hypothetical protein
MHEIFKHIHVLYYILETSLFVILVKLVSRIMFGYCTRIKKKKNQIEKKMNMKLYLIVIYKIKWLSIFYLVIIDKT